MDVKSAVRKALEYVGELFESESISNLGLEEVEFDASGQVWVVTVGFSRPWDYSKNVVTTLSKQSDQPKRSYKIVKIKDAFNSMDAEVISIKTHEVAA